MINILGARGLPALIRLIFTDGDVINYHDRVSPSPLLRMYYVWYIAYASSSLERVCEKYIYI